jgi:hypothetical protein
MSGGGRAVTTTATGSIARRNYGKNHGYKIDGVKVPGVTTITGHYKSGALAKYPGTATADYAVNNWDTLAAMPPAERLKALYAGQYADRDAAAGRGTEVHRVAARIAAGEADVPYADELAGHVEAYRDFLDRTEPKVRAVELIVGNRTHRYCGTLDLIADLGPIEHEGAIIPPARWLLDVKTNRSGIWPETAMQLCGYERAEVFIGEDGDERPMSWLEVERCGAVWVRGDGWDLVPLDTGPDVWQTFTYLAWLYHHEDDRKEWVSAAAGPFADPAAVPA